MMRSRTRSFVVVALAGGIALAGALFSLAPACSGPAQRPPEAPELPVPGLGDPFVSRATLPPLTPAAMVLDAATIVDTPRGFDGAP